MHGESMLLVEASASMRVGSVHQVIVLIWHVPIVQVVSALVVEGAIGVVSVSLGYQMSSSHLRALVAIASSTVLANVVHSLGLLVVRLQVLILNRWYVRRRSLWTNSITHDIIIVRRFRFITLTDCIVLACECILL